MSIQQNPYEFDWFIDLLNKEKVRSYLEIGSDTGESLLRVAKGLPVPSRFVSVDLGGGNINHLWRNMSKIVARGHKAKLVVGDSTDEALVYRVRRVAPFDACFIDANHTLPYVTKDWLNYGPMARIVAFHDIGWKPKEGGPQIDVPEFWESIKSGYRHTSINLNERKNGIGVIWR